MADDFDDMGPPEPIDPAELLRLDPDLLRHTVGSAELDYDEVLSGYVPAILMTRSEKANNRLIAEIEQYDPDGFMLFNKAIAVMRKRFAGKRWPKDFPQYPEQVGEWILRRMLAEDREPDEPARFAWRTFIPEDHPLYDPVIGGHGKHVKGVWYDNTYLDPHKFAVYWLGAVRYMQRQYEEPSSDDAAEPTA